MQREQRDPHTHLDRPRTMPMGKAIAHTNACRVICRISILLQGGKAHAKRPRELSSPTWIHMIESRGSVGSISA